MQLTWYGNTTLLVRGDAGVPILLDPFLGLPGADYRPSLPLLRSAARHIFLTHGHLDHAGSVPKLTSGRADVHVYCTAAPAQVLTRRGVPASAITPLAPGKAISLPGLRVTALPGSHVHFDRALVRQVAFNWRMVRYCYNLPRLGLESRTHREAGETVAYQVDADGQRILILGSMALHPAAAYPHGVQLLVLPYQGRTQLLPAALPIVEQLSPQAILLDHMDNAFPPVSSRIDPSDFLRAMAQLHPDIPVLLPHYGRSLRLPVAVGKR